MTTPVFDSTGHATKAGTITCYYYDYDTNEYTGTSEEYIPVGVSMPGHSTSVKPDVSADDKVNVFANDTWTQDDDYRGKTVYSTSTMESSTVTYIGAIKDGYTLAAPTSEYDKWGGTEWEVDADKKAAADAAANLAMANSEYTRASNQITALQEQLDDEDYSGTDTEATVTAEKTLWVTYRKELRAYIKTADGTQALPVAPNTSN